MRKRRRCVGNCRSSRFRRQRGRIKCRCRSEADAGAPQSLGESVSAGRKGRRPLPQATKDQRLGQHRQLLPARSCSSVAVNECSIEAVDQVCHPLAAAAFCVLSNPILGLAGLDSFGFSGRLRCALHLHSQNSAKHEGDLADREEAPD